MSGTSDSAVSWDAIVVGGGPGGSTAAWSLARAGARVLVLDAARFPRVKLCAGWVTPMVWRALEIDPADYPRTLQPFAEATLEVDGEVLETRWPRPVSYGIVRKEFDDYLLRRAEAAGALVREGTRVQAIAREGSKTIVQAGEATLEAPIVIGAGGHHCPVARAFGEVSREEAVVVARESETRLGTERLRTLTTRHGTPELFAEPDFRGYGWFFTKGDFLNLGIGCMGDAGGNDLHRRCDALVERLRRDGRLATDLELVPFRGHAYAIHVARPRRVAGEGFLLVGDAAGLARGVSGEGIGPAVQSARAAAEAVLTGEARGTTRYAEALTELYGTGESGLLGRLVDLAPRWITETVARAICRTPLLRRRMIFEGAFGMG